MSIGQSGRIVIEVDPQMKRDLYSTLARNGLTLKDWFLKNATSYVGEADQLVFRVAEDPPSDSGHSGDYGKKS